MFPLDYLEDAPKLLNEVLTAIERRELKMLNWGFVDVKSDLKALMPQILEEMPEPGHGLWRSAESYGVTAEDVFEELEQRYLIVKDAIQRHLYRSRFAETIRLLLLLRQRFSHDDWQTASRLVSDIKLDVQPRRYPKRNVSVDELIQSLYQLGASPLYREAVVCLLTKNGQRFSLARFQQDAILEQYQSLNFGRPTSESGVVVGAGTGSGKTKTFYVPALAEIASTLKQEAYVMALAIYPRVELLKDQLAEAFLEARKLDELLQRHSRRMIRIGAYYGDTPNNAQLVLKNVRKIPTASGPQEAWECPFFLCPDCGRPLLWYKADILQEKLENAGNEKRYGNHAILRCRSCYFKTEPGQLALTRDHLDREPPDILFTTTEMLNRNLSQARKHKLMGIEADNPPKMLLLDEIHTYEGLQGAHIAYLLRRWRYARRYGRSVSLCCVGLSATLKSADSFFAKLTGIPVHRVKYISPADEDMEVEGAEYNVMLKGDPVSGSSLLSTTVQTAMLLARMLDPKPDMPSGGFYGQRIFAFTDKLDLVNRLAYILNDAEDYYKKKHMPRPLSQFRSAFGDSEDIIRQKHIAGQIWQTSADIGYRLSDPLQIAVTSSQRRGVNPDASIILATSTLEVGFNDPNVGAVLQHRAPYSLASFLQRKGRAGRDSRRLMRPWMVMVTSDYGRDRLAFHYAERFFEPELKEIDLPINNYYVRKIQAAFALMDWLSLTLKHTPYNRSISVWDALRGTRKDEEQGWYEQRWRKAICTALKEVLDGTQREAFSRYVQQALGIDEREEVESLLWDEPRSLLFDVLPTLLRQLESKWQSITPVNTQELHVELWQDNIADYPMPDFVTPTLFADLNSPGIPVHISGQSQETTLPLGTCLNEFAPGNVSKRYSSDEKREVSHWLEIPEKGITQGSVMIQGMPAIQEMLAIEHLKESLNYDDVSLPLIIDGELYQLYRPRSYSLAEVPKDVANTSSAHLIWRSHFRPQQLSTTAEVKHEANEPQLHPLLSPRSLWKHFFADVQHFTQEHGTWVEVARMAVGVQAETRYKNNPELQRRWLQFVADGQSAGIGFVNYFDALFFRIQPLDVASLVTAPEWEQLYQTFAPHYFLHMLYQDQRIRQAKLSRFEVDRLWELEFSMLVITAIERQCSIADAATYLHTNRREMANDVMSMIFQGQQTEDEDEERVGRLHEKLLQLLEDTQLQLAVKDAEHVLWEQQEDQFFAWLQSCYTSSLGSVLFTALTDLMPDIDPDEVALDIDGEQIWISEMTPGGVGIISRLAETLEFKPREFELKMLDTLEYCERQQLAIQLDTIAEYIERGDVEVTDIFARLRAESTLIEQEQLLETLKALLEQRGVDVTREFMVALRAKFLRPNSNKDTDELIAALVHFWHEQEHRLGCRIELRVIATAVLHYAPLREQVEKVLKRISGIEAVEESQMFNILQSLLWLSCSDSCPDCVEKSQLYQEMIKPSRALLLALLQKEIQPIIYGQDGWEQQVRDMLRTRYHAHIRCSHEQLAACQQTLMDLLITQVDIGYQFFYPSVERIARTSNTWTITMGIREFARA
jgi:superfamily II DNA or RNA helicase